MFLRMVFLFFIILHTVVDGAIWNIPNATDNSSWCYPLGGKWDIELKQCICYKNYFGSFCERIQNCRFGSKINHECLCFYGWKGAACDQIDCKFGIAVNNKTCACNSGIGGIYCDSCLKRYQSPPNCFEEPTKFINENQRPSQCSSNLINYCLNVFLFVFITVYFVINRVLKRREQAMLQQLNSRRILTPEMEALLLAKTHIDPDFIPCPRYDEISSPPLLSTSRQESEFISVEGLPAPPNETSVRVISLHV